jgi:2-methylaconitate cis-trans-isomerase PrpF
MEEGIESMNRDLEPFRCAIMRCGTSKGIFLHENHLPQDPELRDKAILAIFGSPDKRQIDGLGGAEPLTSKVALIGPPSREDADVDYTFGQVEIEDPVIHYDGLCGNISSGVGTFAIEEGLVRAVAPVTRVRVHSVNTKQVYTIDVPVKDGRPLVLGDYKVDGVPGTGAKVTIDMAGTVASLRRGIFPSGKKKDNMHIPGIGEVCVSIVDVVNPVAFIQAKALGLEGRETTETVPRETYTYVQEIRSQVAELLKMEGWRERKVKGPVPFLVFVAPPEEYTNHLTGETICTGDIDFLARAFFLGAIHQTYPGSVSCVTGVAAKLPGTVVNEVSANRDESVVRIGHPAGIIEVESEVGIDQCGNDVVKRITYGRTTRRIMDGIVYVPKDRLEERV